MRIGEKKNHTKIIYTTKNGLQTIKYQKNIHNFTFERICSQGSYIAQY